MSRSYRKYVYEETQCDHCTAYNVIKRDTVQQEYLELAGRSNPQSKGTLAVGQPIEWYVVKWGNRTYHACSAEHGRLIVGELTVTAVVKE